MESAADGSGHDERGFRPLDLDHLFEPWAWREAAVVLPTPEEQYLRKLIGLPPRPPARPADPDDPAVRQLTTAQAAAAAHVAEATIRDWARRKLLYPVEGSPAGEPRYLELHVLQAEARTRRAAREARLLDEAARDVPA
jgi:hypothetical protein